MSSTSPGLRTASIETKGGGRVTLVEIDVTKPRRAALALVFDLSDSCRPMMREVEKLAKLLAPLPREWELWSYTLSNPTAIHEADLHTLAHIHDGSVSLADWAFDGVRRQQAATCGSFLRPVIEAIEIERVARDIGHVTVIVVTDGELTDGMPISVPPEIAVVGLGSQERPNAIAWNRVLQGRPFCTLSDPTLEKCLKAEVDPFFTHCRIEIQGVPSQQCEIQRFDVDSNSLRPWDNTDASWNFADGSLLLVFSAGLTELAAARIRCNSSRSVRPVMLPIASAIASISDQTLRNVEQAFESLCKSDSGILLDLDVSQTSFSAIWRSFVEAAATANTRGRWTNSQGALHVLTEAALLSLLIGDDGRAKYDALLCLVNCDASIEPSAAARLVIVGLEKRSRPPLHWRGGTALSFAVVSSDVVVDYDRRESRWTLRFGNGQAEELEPRGSQKVEKPMPVVGDEHWALYFSGDLR